mgnify:CR=1 FL=1
MWRCAALPVTRGGFTTARNLKGALFLFTGIITDIGTVTKLEPEGDLRARTPTRSDPEPIDIVAPSASARD